MFVRFARVMFYVAYFEYSKMQKGYGSGWSGSLYFCATHRVLRLSVTNDATSLNDDISSQLMLSSPIPKDPANNFSACAMLKSVSCMSSHDPSCFIRPSKRALSYLDFLFLSDRMLNASEICMNVPSASGLLFLSGCHLRACVSYVKV